MTVAMLCHVVWLGKRVKGSGLTCSHRTNEPRVSATVQSTVRSPYDKVSRCPIRKNTAFVCPWTGQIKLPMAMPTSINTMTRPVFMETSWVKSRASAVCRRLERSSRWSG